MRTPPTVLVVNDNAVSLIVTVAGVESAGYRTVTATDGRMALEVFREAYPAAVLMDIDMPVMNGLEASVALRELAQRGELPSAPIIGMSARMDPELATLCREAGMVRMFAKPIDIRELAKALEEEIVGWGTAP